jgi:hypothetical protein
MQPIALSLQNEATQNPPKQKLGLSGHSITSLPFAPRDKIPTWRKNNALPPPMNGPGHVCKSQGGANSGGGGKVAILGLGLTATFTKADSREGDQSFGANSAILRLGANNGGGAILHISRGT